MDHFDLAELFRLAAEKDPGFSKEVFAQMLDRMERLRDDEFGITLSDLDALRVRIVKLREPTLELHRTLGREMGPDHGLEL